MPLSSLLEAYSQLSQSPQFHEWRQRYGIPLSFEVNGKLRTPHIAAGPDERDVYYAHIRQLDKMEQSIQLELPAIEQHLLRLSRAVSHAIGFYRLIVTQSDLPRHPESSQETAIIIDTSWKPGANSVSVSIQDKSLKSGGRKDFFPALEQVLERSGITFHRSEDKAHGNREFLVAQIGSEEDIAKVDQAVAVIENEMKAATERAKKAYGDVMSHINRTLSKSEKGDDRVR